MQVVLVTGTSSGIGRDAVQRLARAGCQVVATARNVADIEDLAGPNVTVAPLDVTSESSMRKAVDAVLAQHGRIDALVNNAGFGAFMPVEETSEDLMRRMFEVNVFGLVRLSQMVLPHLRNNGDRRTRIVNVGSVAGHLSLPMMGPYCASKFAVRALSHAMRQEVRGHGVRVCLIEPGSIATKFAHRARQEHDARPNNSPYADLHNRWGRVTAKPYGAPVKVIGKRIVHACTAKRPKARYTAPWDARGGRLLSRIVPDAWTYGILGRLLRSRPEQSP